MDKIGRITDLLVGIGNVCIGFILIVAISESGYFTAADGTAYLGGMQLLVFMLSIFNGSVQIYFGSYVIWSCSKSVWKEYLYFGIRALVICSALGLLLIALNSEYMRLVYDGVLPFPPPPDPDATPDFSYFPHW